MTMKGCWLTKEALVPRVQLHLKVNDTVGFTLTIATQLVRSGAYCVTTVIQQSVS